jgi:alkanesulfonate monooxygenase SsuD/methylene tetrahydromethanopterin reductase-like flavin-dependent oxidoreductase (luciferase family)
MQFGLFTLFDFFPDQQNEPAYYKDTLDIMIYAEQLGFDSVWVGEEHFYSFGICPSPQLFLATLARETSRLRLATALSVLSLENPLRKAEDFAMLDILSGGRLIFGVGRGAYPKHFEGFRVPWLENRKRYEEALEIIQLAWMQKSFSYKGQFWQIPQLSVSPRPVQKPHPPIYRGIASPEAFEIAGVKAMARCSFHGSHRKRSSSKGWRPTAPRYEHTGTALFLLSPSSSSSLMKTITKHWPRRAKPLGAMPGRSRPRSQRR